jgi:hypothetical protein
MNKFLASTLLSLSLVAFSGGANASNDDKARILELVRTTTDFVVKNDKIFMKSGSGMWADEIELNCRLATRPVYGTFQGSGSSFLNSMTAIGWNVFSMDSAGNWVFVREEINVFCERSN